MAETFSVTPQYIWEPSYRYNVIRTEFESGKEQRKYIGVLPRQWGLSFKGSSATIATVVDFYKARKGSFEVFAWIPPGESTAISARFEEDSLRVTRYGLTSWGECSVTISEVL